MVVREKSMLYRRFENFLFFFYPNSKKIISDLEAENDFVDVRHSIFYNPSIILFRGETSEFGKNFSENSSEQRFNRFNNTLINYDYKTGNYVGYWENKHPQMVNIFIEIARGAKKPTWFFSDKYQELFEGNFKKFVSSYTGRANLRLASSEKWYLFHPSPFDHI
jgi:hypothetical protein